jgi:hypothetical protein
MLKKALVIAVLAALAASPAFAQDPKIEVSGLFGYTFSEGVPISGTAVNGVVYNEVDPKSSMSYGFTAGVYVTPTFEIEFLWARQASQLLVHGNAATLSADMTVDTYQGNFVYNMGDSESMVRPFAFIGVGATDYGDAAFATKTVQGLTRFSWSLGAGVKVFPAKNVGFRAQARWTPTYIKTDGYGWWCDPFWGCAPVGDAEYSNQFDMSAGIVLRF